VSRGTRNDTTFSAVLLGDSEAAFTLTVCGEHVRTLRPDQGTCASLLNAALLRVPDAPLNSLEGKRGCCMGFWLSEGGIVRALERLVSLGGPQPVGLLLEEDAPPLHHVVSELLSTVVPSSYIIVLGDNEGLTGDMGDTCKRTFSAIGVPLIRVGLGATELLSSQCLTIVQYVLDGALGASPVGKPSFDPSDPFADKARPCPCCRPRA